LAGCYHLYSNWNRYHGICIKEHFTLCAYARIHGPVASHESCSLFTHRCYEEKVDEALVNYEFASSLKTGFFFD